MSDSPTCSVPELDCYTMIVYLEDNWEEIEEIAEKILSLLPNLSAQRAFAVAAATVSEQRHREYNPHA